MEQQTYSISVNKDFVHESNDQLYLKYNSNSTNVQVWIEALLRIHK